MDWDLTLSPLPITVACKSSDFKLSFALSVDCPVTFGTFEYCADFVSSF